MLASSFIKNHFLFHNTKSTMHVARIDRIVAHFLSIIEMPSQSLLKNSAFSTINSPELPSIWTSKEIALISNRLQKLQRRKIISAPAVRRASVIFRIYLERHFSAHLQILINCTGTCSSVQLRWQGISLVHKKK